ncbi:1850_t:CDS:2, partial [Funneliformis caledonium]
MGIQYDRLRYKDGGIQQDSGCGTTLKKKNKELTSRLRFEIQKSTTAGAKFLEVSLSLKVVTVYS